MTSSSSGSVVIMKLHAVLLGVCLICAAAGSCNGQQQLVYIGSTLYLPTTNLGRAVTPLRGIFEGNLSRFLVDERYIHVENKMKFQDSSESMLSELSTTFGLSGPIKAISLSLETSFKVLTGSQTNVTSSLVVVESYSRRVFLRQEARRSVVAIPLRTDFLQELRNLPELPSPTPDNAWAPYRNFLLKWGSHYISAIYYGSWLRQWSVAASTRRYSQRQIEAKACAKVTGPSTAIPSIQGCAGFSSQEMNQAMSLQTNDEIEVRGGSSSTASQIAIRRTEALTQSFIQEGRNSTIPVRYDFLPIWRAVLDTYTSSSSKEWRVATALEAYFNGFRAFDCPRQELTSPRITIQQMRRKSNGHYECVRTCVGCKTDDDCTLHAAACYCYGSSCIIAPPPDGKPVVQRFRDNLSTWVLPNLSCFYRFPNCDCNTTSQEQNCGLDGFIPIWSQDLQLFDVM